MKFSIALIAIVFGFISTANLFADVDIDKAAPNFTLMDIEGNSHSLSDFKGKYVVLEWVNFDCPFVKKHYDGNNMQTLQKKFTDQGVVWLSICSSAEGKQGNFSNEEVYKRIKKKKAHMTAYLVDEDGKVGKMYSAKTTPHMFIIDKEGKLVYSGAIDSIRSTDKNDVKEAENYVDKALTELINGKEVATKTTAPYGCSVKYK